MLFGLNMFLKDWNSNYKWNMIGNVSLFRVNGVFVKFSSNPYLRNIKLKIKFELQWLSEYLVEM